MRTRCDNHRIVIIAQVFIFFLSFLSSLLKLPIHACRRSVANGWPAIRAGVMVMKKIEAKYSTHIKTFLRCTGFCLYFLHFIYVKPVRSPLIQRTPAGSSFRLLAQTFYSHGYICWSPVFRARSNDIGIF